VHRLIVQPDSMTGTAIEGLIASAGERLIGRV
jgi:hypothetical protein